MNIDELWWTYRQREMLRQAKVNWPHPQAPFLVVDGVCQGCHQQLSAVDLDRLRRADGVRRCVQCRRILVF